MSQLAMCQARSWGKSTTLRDCVKLREPKNSLLGMMTGEKHSLKIIEYHEADGTKENQVESNSLLSSTQSSAICYDASPLL